MEIKNKILLKELELIKASKTNPKYFAPLYEKYFQRVFFFIQKRVGNADVAGDICSQVFLKALVHRENYEYRGFPFSAWLFRIALNEVNMHFRANSKTIETDLPYDLANDVLTELDNNPIDEERELLVLGLNKLKFEYVELIELRFFEKRRFKEIGEILGLNEDTAKMRVYRALKKLKEIIEEVRG